MKRGLLAVGALFGTVLATQIVAQGETSMWPTYQHDAGRSGVDPDQAQVTSIASAWTSQLDAALYAQPLALGGRVYAATENNTVYGLDAASGAQLWQQHLATPARLSQLQCGNIDPYG